MTTYQHLKKFRVIAKFLTKKPPNFSDRQQSLYITTCF